MKLIQEDIQISQSIFQPAVLAEYPQSLGVDLMDNYSLAYPELGLVQGSSVSDPSVLNHDQTGRRAQYYSSIIRVYGESTCCLNVISLYRP